MNIGHIVIAVFAVAIMTVGLIEWTKGWWKRIPAWFPSVASPILCLALGQLVAPLLLTGNFVLWGIALGLLSLAVTELCYQLIVQSIPQVISGLVSQASGVQIQQQPPAQTPSIHA